MSRLTTETLPSLQENHLQALYSKQIFTVNDFAKADAKIIEKCTRLPFRQVLDLKKILINQYSSQPKHALSYYKSLIKKSAILPTGISKLDQLLEGGLATGNIYEISGRPATGKTTICLTLIKNIVTNLKQNVYYLDTKQDFSGRRMKQILETSIKKEQLVEVMDKIMIKSIDSTYDLINSLYTIKSDIENGLNLKVIIIDSLPGLFLNSEDTTQRNSFLNNLANIMHFMSIEMHVVFVVTNLITLWRESSSFEGIDCFKEKFGCGKYWQTVPNVRIKIECVIDNLRKVTILESVNSPKMSNIDVFVTNFGIE